MDTLPVSSECCPTAAPLPRFLRMLGLPSWLCPRSSGSVSHASVLVRRKSTSWAACRARRRTAVCAQTRCVLVRLSAFLSRRAVEIRASSAARGCVVSAVVVPRCHAAYPRYLPCSSHIACGPVAHRSSLLVRSASVRVQRRGHHEVQRADLLRQRGQVQGQVRSSSFRLFSFATASASLAGLSQPLICNRCAALRAVHSPPA